MIRYYNPDNNSEAVKNIHSIEGCTPENEMPVSSQEWFTRPARDGYEWKLSDKGPWPEEVPIAPPPVEDVAEQKLAEINSTADALLQPVTSTYPNTEIISWDKQEIEAKRWQAWNGSDKTEPEPDTPLIDNILITRTDISKPDLITRIIEKANAYAATGQVFGVRHNLENELETIMADDTLSDDQKRSAIDSINVEQAYSAIAL